MQITTSCCLMTLFQVPQMMQLYFYASSFLERIIAYCYRPCNAFISYFRHKGSRKNDARHALNMVMTGCTGFCIKWGVKAETWRSVVRYSQWLLSLTWICGLIRLWHEEFAVEEPKDKRIKILQGQRIHLWALSSNSATSRSKIPAKASSLWPSSFSRWFRRRRDERH